MSINLQENAPHAFKTCQPCGGISIAISSSEITPSKLKSMGFEQHLVTISTLDPGSISRNSQNL